MSSTIFFFLFIPLLAFILLAVNLIFAPHNPYMEKNSAFECGFSSFLGQNRTQFSISFFIFALLFLLFDLEILLVYPYLVSAYTNGIYGLVIMLMFLLALTLGFAFELGKKALFIDSRQMSNVPINNKSNYISKVKVSPFSQVKKSYTSSVRMLSMTPSTPGVILIAVFNQMDNLALDILLIFFILFAFLLLSYAVVLLSLFIYKCRSIFKSNVIFWMFSVTLSGLLALTFHYFHIWDLLESYDSLIKELSGIVENSNKTDSSGDFGPSDDLDADGDTDPEFYDADGDTDPEFYGDNGDNGDNGDDDAKAKAKAKAEAEAYEKRMAKNARERERRNNNKEEINRKQNEKRKIDREENNTEEKEKEREYRKEWIKNNPEKVRENANKSEEKRKIVRAGFDTEQKEKEREYHREWKKKNPDKVRKNRRKAKNNRKGNK